ncbi:hypothetical protein HMPREF9554_01543 [Treponema phagedenis F0421]|nr:hypothetical protein HMPREF9554_01543 [Treponema phagedenis F0421]
MPMNGLESVGKSEDIFIVPWHTFYKILDFFLFLRYHTFCFFNVTCLIAFGFLTDFWRFQYGSATR